MTNKRLNEILDKYQHFTCEIVKAQVIKAMIEATDEAEREAIKARELQYVTDMT